MFVADPVKFKVNEMAIDLLKWINSNFKTSVVTCSEHSNKEIGMYCSRDQLGLCIKCISTHKDHMNEVKEYDHQKLVSNIQNCIAFITEKRSFINESAKNLEDILNLNSQTDFKSLHERLNKSFELLKKSWFSMDEAKSKFNFFEDQFHPENRHLRHG